MLRRVDRPLEVVQGGDEVRRDGTDRVFPLFLRLKLAALLVVEELRPDALKLIQQDLGPQFALASFGKPVSAEEPWQCVLVRSTEITQYLMLCNTLQLRAEVCGR